MLKQYIDFYDTKISIGTRKRQYINYSLNKGTPFWQTINQANKMFGKKPDYKEPIKPETDDTKWYKEFMNCYYCNNDYWVEYQKADLLNGVECKCPQCGWHND